MEYCVPKVPQEHQRRKYLGSKYNSLILFGLGTIFAIVFIVTLSLMWQSQPSLEMTSEQFSRSKEISGIYGEIAFLFAAGSIFALGIASYLKTAGKNAELSPNRHITKRPEVTKTRDFTSHFTKRKNKKILESAETL